MTTVFVPAMRGARLVGVLALALATAACARTADTTGTIGAAQPGSQQDFVVNVGDRVFFESDRSELTAQSIATLEKQARWLQNYSQYAFTIEGHADERGTREYNIALGARRAQTVRDYLAQPAAHAHDLLRQGTPGRGLQRHLVLVAEPPRRHGARRDLLEAADAKPIETPAPRKGAGLLWSRFSWKAVPESRAVTLWS